MKYERFLKQTEAFYVIDSDIRTNSLSHSYLLATEDDVLREELLTLFALAIFDDGLPEQESVTRRRILNRTAIDYIVLDKQPIGVDDVKPILDDVYMGSMEGKYKVYCIPNFDKANAQVQNKMLKTLEEPLDKVIFLLGTGKESGVLSTVRSRCVKLRLPPIPTKRIIDILIENGEEKKNAEIAAAASNGLLTKALETLQNGYSIQLADELFDVITRLKTTKDIPDHINNVAFSKENINLSIDLLISLFRDIMIEHIGGKTRDYSFPYRKYEIGELAKRYPRTACVIIINELIECKKKIRFNCNEKNVADSLLQKILEVRYKCLL